MDSSLCERPNTNPEDTGIRQDQASSERRSGKQKVHSLIDKVFSRTNLVLAWEKVKKNRGSGGLDDLTMVLRLFQVSNQRTQHDVSG